MRRKGLGDMAAKNTGKSTGTKKNTTSVKKGTPVKNNSTKSGSTKSASAKSTGKNSAKQTTKGKKEETAKVQEPVVKEELIPEFSNELILLVTLVVSVLLFLSNFSLSGKVGEVINQVTFGLFGVLAYIIPFFIMITVLFGTKAFEASDLVSGGGALGAAALYYVGLWLMRGKIEKDIVFKINKL